MRTRYPKESGCQPVTVWWRGLIVQVEVDYTPPDWSVGQSAGMTAGSIINIAIDCEHEWFAWWPNDEPTAGMMRQRVFEHEAEVQRHAENEAWSMLSTRNEP